MKSVLAIFVLLLLVVGCSTSMNAGNKGTLWQLAMDKQGVQVYTRTVEGGGFMEFRGVTTMETSISSLIALVRDVEASPDWVAYSRRSELLKWISPNESYTYSLSTAPWPVKPRDVVVHNVMSQDKETLAVTIRQTGKPDYIAESSNAVRVQRIEGLWQFTPLNDGHVEVVYQLLSEPGGGLPVWLVNASLVLQPYLTLLNMQQVVKREKYQTAPVVDM